MVQTLELGDHDGTLYLVMEWVDGETLNQVMSRASEQGGLPLPIAVNLIGQACEGLQAAHDLRDESGALLGVVHRDISPQNLLIAFSGTAKLVDFGIAKVTARSSGLTQAGEVKGKFAYMAPEQVRGQVIDARTDLFSLGILLYAVTTGKHPFRGSHPGETLQNICSATPAAPPSSFLPDYPPELEQVVLKALAKQPDERFSSAREMLQALDAAVPSALTPGFEAQVADYLKQMFGAKVSERRNAIRNAQLNVDRQRGDAAATSGTLRAISINQHESGQFSFVPTPVPAAGPTVPVPAMQVQAQAPKQSHRGLIGGSIALGAAVALGVILRVGAGSGGAASATAASPVPRDMVTLDRPAAVAPAASVSSSPPVPSTVASSEVEGEGRSRKSGRSPRMPTAVVARPTAAPAVPSGPVAAPPTIKPEASAATTTNAWDRGAFGGRH